MGWCGDVMFLQGFCETFARLDLVIADAILIIKWKRSKDEAWLPLLFCCGLSVVDET